MKKHLKTSLLQALWLLGCSCLFAAGPDGNGNILYVSDYYSANVYQIDTVTNAVSGTISVGSFPPFNEPLGIAISHDGSFAYITDDYQSTVYKVNTANNKVEATLDYGTFTPSRQMMEPLQVIPLFM